MLLRFHINKSVLEAIHTKLSSKSFLFVLSKSSFNISVLSKLQKILENKIMTDYKSKDSGSEFEDVQAKASVKVSVLKLLKKKKLKNVAIYEDFNSQQ